VPLHGVVSGNQLLYMSQVVCFSVSIANAPEPPDHLATSKLTINVWVPWRMYSNSRRSRLLGASVVWELAQSVLESLSFHQWKSSSPLGASMALRCVTDILDFFIKLWVGDLTSTRTGAVWDLLLPGAPHAEAKSCWQSLFDHLRSSRCPMADGRP